MPSTSRLISQFLVRFALVVFSVVGGGLVSASAMVIVEEPVDVVTLVPAKNDGSADAVLMNVVGGVSATSAVRPPEGRIALLAQTLSAQSSGSRSYGVVRVSVFRMVDESIAYALVRFLQPDGAVRTELGDDGWDSSKESAARVGVFVMHVAGGSEAQRSTITRAVVGSVRPSAPAAPIMDQLPTAGRIDGSERYVSSLDRLRRFRPDIVDDVYRLEAGGADGAIADYAQQDAEPARLLIVEYQTPQLASEAHRTVIAWFEGLDPAARASRVLKREGNFIVEATGVLSPEAFRQTVDAVKYDYQIKMLQGPNPAVGLDAAKEAYTTAMLLLGSVRLVGAGVVLAVMIGVTLGAVVFIRRRKAAANLFSDAGGMVHLTLEAPVRSIEPGRQPRALLQDRSES